jgi:hypothetical protein
MEHCDFSFSRALVQGTIAKTVHFDSPIEKMGHFSDLCKNSPVFLNSNLRQGLFRSCVSLA